MRRIRPVLRHLSSFTTQLTVALLKAVVTSIILGIAVVSIMHYMGVPVPSADDLLRGVTRLAHVLS
jgi:hypothetical protein